MTTAERRRLTEDEYLAFERESPDRHEFVNGEILAMTGGSPLHSALGLNIGGALAVKLQSKPCRPFGSDLRIHVPATGLYAYPNVTVICGNVERHRKDPHTLLNPVVIVEVLSDSTERFDRGAKFAHYQSIPTLKEYLLVSQSEERVEHFERLASGQWLLTVATGPDGRITLPALECELPLAEVYAKTEGLRA